MIADLKKTYDLGFPLVGVLTDYAPHSYWMYDNVDAYVVPSGQTKDRFIMNNIKENKIFPFGIPISPDFSESCGKEAALRHLRLEPDVPTVLIMGGGQGLGPIEELIFAINTLPTNFQVIVVCGLNNKLRKWLEKRRVLFRKKMAILGYTKDVNMLMDAADLIVSKPGGLTTAESLAKCLPIVIVNPIPGQEAKNTEFLLGEGVAVKARNPLDAAGLIEELLSDPERLRRMRNAAAKHARPQAAMKIAQLALNLMQRKKS
jgi:processive 1,2-diacylglycerol beta-glucosyltransferase